MTLLYIFTIQTPYDYSNAIVICAQILINVSHNIISTFLTFSTTLF